MSDVLNILKDFLPLWLVLIAFCFVYLICLYTKIVKMQNNFAKEQSDFLTKRIDSIEKTTGIFEKTIQQQEKNFDTINKENEKLKKQLIEANIDPQSYYVKNVIINGNNELKNKIKIMTDRIESLMQGYTDDNFDLNLSLANAYAINEEWTKSAKQFEKVTKAKNTSWELYFSQGTAFANSRLGKESHLKAFQAYSSAIVFLPDEIEDNIKARLYIYKGAILKRLNRLIEAENNIKIGLEYATDEYEINDGLYNLSCVYAIQNEKDKYYEVATKLKHRNIDFYYYLINRLNEYAPVFKKNYKQ